jgi:ketosteroid isomerase-like protein
MKLRLLLTLAGLAISPVVSAIAQEQNTVDPNVYQQIEAAHLRFGEAYNKHDAAATAALFTADAIQVREWESAGGVASGQQAIEKRYEAQLESVPGKLVRKLIQVCPIGDEICAISAFTHPNPPGKPGYCVAIYVRELDEWKIRTEYWK